MLPTSFYQQPTLELAPALLGKYFHRKLNGQTLIGRIVEVEAYHQDGDQAAHSFSGKTQRNQTMFGSPGYLYVYFIYGMHYCMNVVSEEAQIGAAVLIRALEPIAGFKEMQRLRGPKIKGKQLTNGPAKCCAAFAIDRNQDGINLQSEDIFLSEGMPNTEPIKTSHRIGITKSADLPWRFFLDGNPYVSRHPKGAA